jgi:hypothetical protein
MGILDDLLGGMAGQGMSGRAQANPTQAGSGAGMSQVLLALMPGISSDQASHGFSELLPDIADRMSPGGEVPDSDGLANQRRRLRAPSRPRVSSRSTSGRRPSAIEGVSGANTRAPCYTESAAVTSGRARTTRGASRVA